MKIYTRTGDRGETGLYGGGRVSKADPRVEAYGELDELNSVIGMVRTNLQNQAALAPIDMWLERIQSRLFDFGAELANPTGKELGIPLIDDDDVAELEKAIDEVQAEVPPQRFFILPGGSRLAAELHFARCVCRRAERRLVALANVAEVRPVLIRYLNRLSDFLFVLARLANHRLGIEDVPWKGRKTKSETP
ncbi:MAG: cob(I)yrinic acid a,c-diamide adenosyltransferase [Deltaproteobacteria bacterium]|nr:cob(I)yrinic acid a,c-diamide adenosyltransferase [Sandaracinaceae bacterium]MCX7808560.1 cob(I)yrinic acid a,c-diamide adenosyltransferase [Deltaproteobacteria bacterium]MDW8245284.1 cob(I)yrinic acid a,c-diamide adenosyltransferase [Sandaracinaceae bacterium]